MLAIVKTGADCPVGCGQKACRAGLERVATATARGTWRHLRARWSVTRGRRAPKTEAAPLSHVPDKDAGRLTFRKHGGQPGGNVGACLCSFPQATREVLMGLEPGRRGWGVKQVSR